MLFGDIKITDEDLPKIEKKMSDILSPWDSFEKKSVSKKEAENEFSDNEYKKELIEEFTKEDKELTLYRSGEFTDLCRGGHVSDLSKISPDSWRLDRVAGAYWRGDENNKMLTRIYGLAFETKKELEEYLKNQEEAKKRDHRKLGKELDLFHIGYWLLL